MQSANQPINYYSMKQITLNSGAVIVTDPCYEPHNGHNTTLHDIRVGKWNCEATVKDCGAWGKRISRLTIRHEDTPKCRPTEYVGSAAVDSGQCGFFDPAYFEENQPDDDFDNMESWYRRVCELTLNEPDWGTIEEKGVVSSSGFGDGRYGIYASRDKSGFITGLQLRFI